MRVKIFGTDWNVGHFGSGTGLLVRVYEEEVVDWSQVPDVFEVDGKPYTVHLHYASGRFAPYDRRDGLVHAGWKMLNPNGAKLHDLERSIDVHRRNYEQALNNPDQFRVLIFYRDERRNGALRAELIDSVRCYRNVYGVDSTSPVHLVRPGVPYACMWVRTCKDEAPNGLQYGFRFDLVRVVYEFFDPDERIEFLRAQIAAGSP